MHHHRSCRVRYTVWSRGRLIGETDLGFRRFMERIRCGWFRPNAEGERLMPLIAEPVQALRDEMLRQAAEEAGIAEPSPQVPFSTILADMAESHHHLMSAALELRRD